MGNSFQQENCDRTSLPNGFPIVLGGFGVSPRGEKNRNSLRFYQFSIMSHEFLRVISSPMTTKKTTILLIIRTMDSDFSFNLFFFRFLGMRCPLSHIGRNNWKRKCRSHRWANSEAATCRTSTSTKPTWDAIRSSMSLIWRVVCLHRNNIFSHREISVS